MNIRFIDKYIEVEKLNNFDDLRFIFGIVIII